MSNCRLLSALCGAAVAYLVASAPTASAEIGQGSIPCLCKKQEIPFVNYVDCVTSAGVSWSMGTGTCEDHMHNCSPDPCSYSGFIYVSGTSDCTIYGDLGPFSGILNCGQDVDYYAYANGSPVVGVYLKCKNCAH